MEVVQANLMTGSCRGNSHADLVCSQQLMDPENLLSAMVMSSRIS